MENNQSETGQPQQQRELTSHEIKLLKKEQRKQEEQVKENQKIKKETKSKLLKYSIIAVISILAIVGGFSFIKSVKSAQPYYRGSYHIHSNIDVSLCGVEKPLRCANNLCGPMNFHHHNDNIIHMEGKNIYKKEDLALGNFFKGLNSPFSETQIFDKKNGDLCPDGKPGMVKMYVNGLSNNQFNNYILNQCDDSDVINKCEKIQIKFE